MQNGIIGSVTQTIGNLAQNGQHPFSAWMLDANPPANFANELNYAEIIVSLSLAAILGGLIAYHPRRQIDVGGEVSDIDLKKTKILICVAGAILVPLIQGSLELAFGLVGLGGLVRYRTVLSNPVDLSVVFILIGLGMACGLHLYKFAFTMVAFVYFLLYILDLGNSHKRVVWTLKVDATDPASVNEAFQILAEKHRLEILRKRSSNERGGFRCQFFASKRLNTEQLSQEIRDHCGQRIIFTRFEWEMKEGK